MFEIHNLLCRRGSRNLREGLYNESFTIIAQKMSFAIVCLQFYSMFLWSLEETSTDQFNPHIP